MDKKLTIYFTSDLHGYFSPLNYAAGTAADTGAANCMAQFENDGNTLILDGGDTLQGSPLTYYLHKNGMDAPGLCAQVMNCAGYDFFTLGNHDFNYGPQVLNRYIKAMEARCLCANVSGLENVWDTAVVTMKNGLRVGLTGIVTHHINIWERAEHLAGITVSEPLPAAEAALKKLREQHVDITVCIYHGGFENDLNTGALLSESDENQGYRLCRELDFDVVLTGHQHLAIAPRKLLNSFICQTPDKGRQFARLVLSANKGSITMEGSLENAGSVTYQEAAAILKPLDEAAAKWLDTPVGHLDQPLLPKTPIEMASGGSNIANFINQVQLAASGADISCTSLGNEVKGFSQDVTVRDVVATYIYSNTLQTLRVDRAVLKQALERCASYFDLQEDGKLQVSQRFLKPKVEHYNYDYFSGIEVTMDLRKPLGQRVISIRYQERELPPEQSLNLCMNDYRASGTGGYDCYRTCQKVKEQNTEISELIMDYVLEHGNIQVDKTKWLHVLH